MFTSDKKDGTQIPVQIPSTTFRKVYLTKNKLFLFERIKLNEGKLFGLSSYLLSQTCWNAYLFCKHD